MYNLRRAVGFHPYIRDAGEQQRRTRLLFSRSPRGERPALLYLPISISAQFFPGNLIPLDLSDKSCYIVFEIREQGRHTANLFGKPFSTTPAPVFQPQNSEIDGEIQNAKPI